MKEIATQEMDVVSGGACACDCTCFQQHPPHGIPDVRRIGRASDLGQCTDSCQKQFGPRTPANCNPL